MWFLPFLWFVIITITIVYALPRVFDAILYYFDRRSRQFMKEIEMEHTRLGVIKEQMKLQEMGEKRGRKVI